MVKNLHEVLIPEDNNKNLIIMLEQTIRLLILAERFYSSVNTDSCFY